MEYSLENRYCYLSIILIEICFYFFKMLVEVYCIFFIINFFGVFRKYLIKSELFLEIRCSIGEKCLLMKFFIKIERLFKLKS